MKIAILYGCLAVSCSLVFKPVAAFAGSLSDRSLMEVKKEEKKKCKLVLIFDDTTPPWLFWKTAPGSDACPDGAGTCLTSGGEPPPSKNISEGDEFEGECWAKMPNNGGKNEPVEDSADAVRIGYPAR